MEGPARSLEHALRQVPFLSHLTDEQLRELAASGGSVRQDGQQVVFREGEAADRLYVILSGAVRIFRRDDQGNEVALASLGAGGFFGEIALLDGGTRSASSATVEQCEFFTLEREAFFELLSASPRLLSNIFTDLTAKVRETTQKLFQEELAARTLEAEMEKARHQALAQMVAGVAHEINTPLGIVNTAASMIKRGLGSSVLGRAAEADQAAKSELDDALDALTLLERNVGRAHQLVQNFKNLSVSQVVDTCGTFDLPTLVAEVLELYRLSARQAKLAV